MSAHTQKPVLIIGGAGLVGSQTARTLRRLQPGLPLTLGGRDLARAGAVARELGGADAVRVDLERPDLGLPDGRAFSAVAMFVKDDTLHSVKYAQAKGVPHVGISTAMFELAPEVALFIHQPARAPILLASQWLAGAATLSVLHFAKEFRALESIDISAVLDEEDLGGPAAYADFERQTQAAPNAQILEDGKWRWVHGEAAARTFKSVDGTEVRGQAYSLLDGMSLAAATGARSIRFDLSLGQSSSRRRGEPFSTEIILELTGELRDGTKGRVRHELVHPSGQAPVTAVGVAVALERLLGLSGGAPVAPGLYLPEVLVEPAYLVRRLEEFGTRFRRV
ncbi:NAD(P)-dependent oxidoreductase [Pyxidicoccus trucidator]|uniref:NAD(P)-dependent oxidoreductase n=1 Tax=Pyxidicoccus trucidator TaxID=2709662 RepID=UPI0013DC90C1|nr:NAD(P)-dependent oxidoreductase [Pyxidicoccus trucidator]